MKKYVLLATTVLLLFPSIAVAQSDENVTKRRPDRPAQVEIQEIREDRMEDRQERRSTVAENHANRLERRFEFYYKRLTNIITRFERRLDILKADGKDVSSVADKVSSVKAKLEEAKTKGMAAVSAFKAIDPAKLSEQKVEMIAARDIATEARKLFMETHTLLKDALKSLKAISKPALPAASAAVENAQ
jgi:hypothetical protein